MQQTAVHSPSIHLTSTPRSTSIYSLISLFERWGDHRLVVTSYILRLSLSLSDDDVTRLIVQTPCHAYSMVPCLSSHNCEPNIGFVLVVVSIHSDFGHSCRMRL